MRYKMKYLYYPLFLLLLLSLSLFFKYPASALDDVRLGKVSEWNNNYGEFHAVKVKEINGTNYAFCATSKGIVTFRIYYETTNKNRKKANLSLVEPFIPMGDCTDIEITGESGGFGENIYVYITVEDEESYRLYIRNVTNPEFSYYVGSCNIPAKANGLAVSGGYAHVACEGSGLQVIDIHDPTGPVIVGNCDTSSAKGVVVSGGYAYIADDETGLQLIDITDPTKPVVVGNCNTPGSAYSVAVSGLYAYIAAKESGLQVIDISDLTDPKIVGSFDTTGSVLGVSISEGYAYVADAKSGLLVLDITDPTRPVVVGSCNTPCGIKKVAASGGYAYVMNPVMGLQIIDISDSTGPMIVGSIITPGVADDVVVSGYYAYVADWGKGLQAIDISNPTSPVIIGNCDTPGNAARGIAISENYAYVADGGMGLQVIDIQNPNEPEIVGSCDTPDKARGVTVSGDYAYVADCLEGLQVIDIRNPNKPEIVGSCNASNQAFGVAVSGDYAYVANYGGGLLVIDISHPTNPMIVGTCNIHGLANRVAISENYAYVADWVNGLQVIDITDPMRPMIAGSCDTFGRAYGVSIYEEYAYVADGGSGLHIINISDPNEPASVGSCDTPDSSQGVYVSGGYAYLADKRNGLQVIDITDSTGPTILGSSETPGNAQGLVISGDYVYVADGGMGFRIINIKDTNGAVVVGRCETPGYARGLAISGDYAYIADGGMGLQVIDISDPSWPVIIKSCDISGNAFGVDISGEYAYVADYGFGFRVINIRNPIGPWMVSGSIIQPSGTWEVKISEGFAYMAALNNGLQVIGISNPARPMIMGSFDTPGCVRGVDVFGDYAYLANETMGLQVIDISDPNRPVIVGNCDTPGEAYRVTVSEGYAYVTEETTGLQVIDISDPSWPVIVGSYDTPGEAYGVTVSEGYVYVADGKNGLLKLQVNIGPPPLGKGNLILVAGGNINYKALAPHTTSPHIRKRAKAFNHTNLDATYWEITQTLANHVLHTFNKNGYEVYEIYYFNPDPIQDIDNDNIPNHLIVDDFTPTSQELQDIIKKRFSPDHVDQFPQDHLANSDPLYIYLIGHAAEDKFLIMANEIITADELRNAIHIFQHGYTDNKGIYHPGTNRHVIVVIESAASGTFIDNLKDSDITVITSTDDRASYIKPVEPDSTSDITTPEIPYKAFTTAFMDAVGPYLDPKNIPVGRPETLNARINGLLKEAFIAARGKMEEWALTGPPFSEQAPQMALPDATFTSLTFSENGITPLRHLDIGPYPDVPHELTILGHVPNTSPSPIPQTCTFFSSDPTILDPDSSEDIEFTLENNGKPLYRIYPKKNGRVSLMAYPDDVTDPDHLLSARITIEVSIDDPSYSKDLEKMAIIVAGYQGTGDYLWESTNTIANHAYRTLRAMGYTKQEICYYNPYLLQDPIENKECDDTEECNDIDGYPKLDIFDLETDPYSSYGAFASINDPNMQLKEVFLFLFDHGTKGVFRLNPTSFLEVDYLINQLENIEGNVSDNIILLYDACYSGSFLDEIKEKMEQNSSLAEKLITITSTDPNQIAYYLNQGIVSFSYPFFDEWYLTHSLNKAFVYARDSLPQFGESATSLKGQTPEIYDPNTAREWDLKHIYYIDEAKPLMDNVLAYRSGGNLYLSADVFSLTGIDRVWATIEGAQNTLTSFHGRAITQATEIFLSLEDEQNEGAPSSPYGGRYKIAAPDPCPTETTYTINIYAQDKSRMPKTAFFKTGIDDNQAQNIRVVILATDTDLIDDQDERERFTSQLERAKMILQNKIPQGQIIHITNLDSLEAEVVFEANHHTLKEQNLFIYLFGKVDIQENTPIFILNADEGINPEYLYSILPWDTNQRVLILMDTPYSGQFLSSCGPDSWHENWAGIASTGQGELFFPIYGESDGNRFPCFSNFFFSMVLSGATVAQAYRMAKNAVSLTQQQPGLFLRQEAESEYAINHYLNYYLGTSAIHGEDHTLFTDCSARVENGNTNLMLSLTAHPDIETDDFTAWVILKSSPSSIYQRTMIIKLEPIGQSPVIPVTGQENTQGPLYINIEDILYNTQYCEALFMVEGRRQSDESSRIEWQKVPIVAPGVEIGEDGFEPDDDPNSTMFYARREIFVNALPSRHTFYCEHNPQDGQCNDTDWVYFYAWKGISYEIYAQDLSEYGYFIKLTLYDPDTSPIYPNAKPPLSGTNYMSFTCKKSGYHLLKTLLVSSYPPKGIEYILAVCSPQAGEFTTLFLEVINPKVEEASGLRSDLTITVDDKCISAKPRLIPPDSFWYELHNIEPDKKLIIKVYQGNEAQGEPLCEKEIIPLIDTLNLITFNLKDPSECCCIVPNWISPYPYDLNDYESGTAGWRGEYWYDPGYPWNLNNPLPGDMDESFPLDGDFDGDQISNYDEHSLNCSGIYPTVPLYLHKGINLYYFPLVFEIQNIIKPQSCFYDSNTGNWEDLKKGNPDNPYKVDCYYYDKQNYDGWKFYKRLKSNTFNAIYSSEEGGVLFLDLKRLEHPILCLKSFCWDPNSKLNHIENLNKNEIWSKYVKVEKGTDFNQGTLSLSWDFSGFDPPYLNGNLLSLYSEDNEGKRSLLVKDMLQTTQYQIKPEGDLSAWGMCQLTYVIEWNKETSVEINIPEGWGMISLPVISNDMHVSNLFPDAEVIYGYKKKSGYVRIKGGEKLEAEKGYWILFKDAQNLLLSGDSVYEYSFLISESGWDMIGGCTFSAKASADSCTIDVIYSYVPGFGYQKADFIEPGKGYWILYNNIIDQCEINVKTEK